MSTGMCVETVARTVQCGESLSLSVRYWSDTQKDLWVATIHVIIVDYRND
jgi:hypothetical protein